VTAVRQDDIDFLRRASSQRRSRVPSWLTTALVCDSTHVTEVESQATHQSQKCWTVSGRQDQPLQSSRSRRACCLS
jgi:hypothetical protein